LRVACCARLRAACAPIWATIPTPRGAHAPAAPPLTRPRPPCVPAPRHARALSVSRAALCASAAKNVILAGVAAVTLADTSAVAIRDLSAQFYLAEEDVGRNRAEACAPKLHELNPAVAVSAHTAPLTEDFLKNFEARAPSTLACHAALRASARACAPSPAPRRRGAPARTQKTDTLFAAAG
jgi:hypothetical protein